MKLLQRNNNLIFILIIKELIGTRLLTQYNYSTTNFGYNNLTIRQDESLNYFYIKLLGILTLIPDLKEFYW